MRRLPIVFVCIVISGCQISQSPEATLSIALTEATPSVITPSPYQELMKNPMPLPSFIDGIAPKPSSTNKRGNSDAEQICVGIRIQPLLRPGDRWTKFSNIKLSFDGEEVNELPNHTVFDGEASEIYDENGELVARGPYDDSVCWNAVMQPGLHAAEITVWTSSGDEFTYQWAFQITE